MKSKLSNKGYVIMKDEYSDKELKKIKKNSMFPLIVPIKVNFLPLLVFPYI